jgi:hypothetical protein
LFRPQAQKFSRVVSRKRGPRLKLLGAIDCATEALDFSKRSPGHSESRFKDLQL